MRWQLDLAPNPWWVWGWVDVVVQRLARAGFASGVLAASCASLIERLRIDLARERDRLAADVVARRLADGRIGFAPRTDASKHALPLDVLLETKGAHLS